MNAFLPILLAPARLAGAVFLMMAVASASAGVVNIPEIGAHEPILTVEKNVHPGNKMVVYTKVDESGRFVPDPANRQRPMLDFYWLIDGRNYKPVNPMIKSEITKRLACQWSAGERAGHFVVDVNDLKEVKSDIRDPKMDIYASESGGAPKVEAQMNLGPSDGNMRIRLSSIYTEGRAFPPAVNAVTLRGEELVNGSPTGRKVTRRYFAAGRAE